MAKFSLFKQILFRIYLCFKIKFYTAEEIKNKNAVTLADFLLTENNFTITQDPILGTKVSINGMSGSDLKLMIDGIPVAGRLNGNIDYSQVLLGNIEKIEVNFLAKNKYF